MKHIHLGCAIAFFAVGLLSLIEKQYAARYSNEAIYHQVTFLGNMILALMSLRYWSTSKK